MMLSLHTHLLNKRLSQILDVLLTTVIARDMRASEKSQFFVCLSFCFRFYETGYVARGVLKLYIHRPG